MTGNKIPFDKVISGFDPAAFKIAELVSAAGGRAVFVGGCIRDALLGTPAEDMDIEVFGLSKEGLSRVLSSDFRVNLVGASFGVFKIHGHKIDIAIPRTEIKSGISHRDFDIKIDPELPFKTAAARRDFTVNAIMYDPLSGTIIDPWNGRKDLNAGILRHVGEQFSEDPLRVLRGMQFISRFGFKPARETLQICRTIKPEGISRERLAGEWEKMLLNGIHIADGLRFLKDCSWLNGYPELKNLVGCPQDPRWHPEGDVWTHTLLAADHLPFVRHNVREDDLIVSLAVLCHDFGKPAATKRLEDGHITSFTHETIADDLISSFISRLWNRTDLEDNVKKLVRTHMRPVALILAGATDKAYRRLAVDSGRPDLLADLVECDMSASAAGVKTSEVAEKFRAVLSRLRISDAPPAPFIRGRDLIKRGFVPGPEVGACLKQLYNAQISGKFNSRIGALRYLKKISPSANK